MHVCTTLRSAATRLREKNTKKKCKIKKYQKKKVTNRYISRMRGGALYPTDCNGSLHIGLGHQRYQSCTFLWL
jgi:hypothetical protein